MENDSVGFSENFEFLLPYGGIRGVADKESDNCCKNHTPSIITIYSLKLSVGEYISFFDSTFLFLSFLFFVVVINIFIYICSHIQTQNC